MTKRKMDEYDEIYKQYEGSGLVFDYNKGYLSTAKDILKEDVEKIDLRKRNSDNTPMFVRCRVCESYMDFTAGSTDMFSGYWQCPSCGVKVRERTPYSRLSRNQFERAINQDEDDEPEWL